MRPIGLLHLHRKYRLQVPEPAVRTFIHQGPNREEREGATRSEYLSERYDPGTEDRYHLEFSLKREGLDLRVLAAWFQTPVASAQIVTLVQEKPTGEYARRLWFLYEWLTGTTLPLEDGASRAYLPLLDPDTFVVRASPQRSRRHHVDNNLLGPPLLCPLVRRSAEVDALIAQDFAGQIARLVPTEDLDLLFRAVSYLYLKETRSSFEIEGETLSANRNERFVAQLEEVTAAKAIHREDLLRWQADLVDPRYAADDYRETQVYVADASRQGRLSRIHYIAPRAKDVARFMEAFFELGNTLSSAPPIVHAALWSFAFVFIHPFEDGNGRLHRLLFHNVLRRRGLTPDRVILPVSAVILSDRAQYDRVLESFSRPVMEALSGRYSLTDSEEMEVTGETMDLYRSYDAAPMVLALGGWMKRALEHELVDEIAWLQRYDTTRELVRDIVDMPDRKLRALLGILENNGGRLSANKRALFTELTDAEVSRIEAAVQAHLLAK